MKIISKRLILATLAGIVAGILVGVFSYPGCWGILVGVVLSVSLANVTSRSEGTLVGAITLLPIGVFLSTRYSLQTGLLDQYSLVWKIVLYLFEIIFFGGLGALMGLLFRWLLKFTRQKNLIP
jgi:hypothetical protein